MSRRLPAAIGILVLVATVVAACFSTHDILVGPRWSLIEVGGAAPAADALAEFHDDGTFAASTGCNSLSGTYHLEGNRILIDSEITTASACGPDTAAQESLVLAILHARPAYAIDTGTGHLRITADDGRALLYERR